MKILLVSVFSNHMFNWILQLRESEHEIHWLDVNDANTYVKSIDFIQQTVKWKRRIEYPGRYWIKKNIPLLDSLLEKVNNRRFIDIFQEKMAEIQPDVVQSFEMHSSCVPILEVMRKYPEIKWIYSAWGNDLFYHQHNSQKLQGIKEVFTRLDYMFADCTRDFLIAKKYGFKGEYLGTYPTGGGYDLQSSNSLLNDLGNRKTILVKGYEHKFGRAINILKALLEIKAEIKDFNIVVFAATDEVLEYVKQPQFSSMENLVVKRNIARGEVLELMGKSLLYIGNSTSDGMPNTVLEAIIMESFPIQSNPGGATAEIIKHGENGFLIENPANCHEIAALIKKAIENPQLLKSGIEYNSKNIKPKLERKYIREQVLRKYELIEENL